MKKNITFTILLLLMVITQKIHAQVECFQAKPFFVENFDNSPYVTCIETPTGVYHNNHHHAKSWLASDFIDLNGIAPYLPTEFNPYGFQANIKPAPFTVALLKPSNASAVPKWGMIEYGVALPPSIAQKVKNFVEDLPGDKINPYLEWEIKVTATFQHGSNVQKKVDGFYTKDFTATYPSTIPAPASEVGYSVAEYTSVMGAWTEVPTAFPFRVRFAPFITGGWSVYFTVTTPIETFTSPYYNFNVVDMNLNPPVGIGLNKRFLKRGVKTFFPIGCNLATPDLIDPQIAPLLSTGFGKNPPSYRAEKAPPIVHKHFRDRITKLKNKGANTFRFLMYAPASDIEFEHLGNYTSRLNYAWEMDKMMEHSKNLGMYVQWNMLDHFHVCTYLYQNTFWDWKSNNNGVTPVDTGYCYHTQVPGVDVVQDFFTNPTAMKYWKQRIRYIVSRWGYYNNLLMFELMSEVSNTGKIMKDTIIGDDTLSIEVANPYPDNIDYRYYINDWQKKMLKYIKEDLDYSYHLISPSYAGPPKTPDNFYSEPQLDVCSRNVYDNYPDPIKTVNFNYFRKISKEDILQNYGKPMIYSEFGPISVEGCNYTETFRNIWKILFTGVAMALDWHFAFTSEHWDIFGRVKQFMQGYNLNGGDWLPGNIKRKNNGTLKKKDNWEENMTRHDLKADLMYLRAGDRKRAIGVVTNRTWNYWTASNGTCGTAPTQYTYEIIAHPPINVNANLDVYAPVSSVKSHESDILMNKLKVCGMKWKKYVIYYYDAQNPLLPISIQFEWGPKLNLEYPDLTSARPFVLFKAVLLDELINDGTINPGLAPSNQRFLAGKNFNRDTLITQKDSVIRNEETMQKNNRNGSQIKLYPNPASQKVTIEIPDVENNYSVTILNNSSKVLMTGITLNKKLNRIDISKLSKGVYQVVVTGKSKIIHFKLVVE